MISEEPKIGERAKVTPLEKRLARRIHNQRRRLQQWEDMDSWRKGAKDRSIRNGLVKMVLARGKWIKELEAALKPFADLANAQPQNAGDDWGVDTDELRVGDLRRARDALTSLARRAERGDGKP